MELLDSRQERLTANTLVINNTAQNDKVPAEAISKYTQDLIQTESMEVSTICASCV